MTRMLAVAVGLLAAAVPLHAQTKPPDKEPGRVQGAQQVDEAFARAIKANDVEALVALYASDAVLFPPGAMQQKGKEAIRQGFAEFLGAFRVTDFSMADVQYVTSGNLSAGWGRWVLSAVPRAGGPALRWEGRGTSVARRINGKWLYISDHASIPEGPPPPQVPRPVSEPGR